MRNELQSLYVLRNDDRQYWNETEGDVVTLQYATVYSGDDSASGNVPLPTNFYWARLIDVVGV